MKLQLQSESAECGLACLQMILSAHRDVGDISELRRRFNVGLKGATLRQLMQLSAELQLSSRALSLSLDELPQLQLPCILHWDLNHFVVLSKVGRKTITILDPAVGKRSLSLTEASRHFTGVALELTPNTKFWAPVQARRLSLRSLTGRVTGL